MIKARGSIEVVDEAALIVENSTQLEQRLNAEITTKNDSITQYIEESYYTKGDTDTLLSKQSTQMQQTVEGWEMQFNNLISTVNANQQGTDASFQEWQKYIRFVDGDIVLGQNQNPIILTIKNDRISFTQSGEEVAYLSDNQLVITDASILHSLRIGNFAFVPRANGSLDFKKVS